MKKTIFQTLALIFCLLVFMQVCMTKSFVNSDMHVDQPESFGLTKKIQLPTDTAVVYLDPETTHGLIGSTFMVNVCVDNVTDLFSYQLTLYYDTDLLSAVDAKLPSGHFLEPVKPSNMWIVGLDIKNDFNSTHGSVYVGVTLLSPELGKSGHGVLATISFHVRDSGACVLDLYELETILVDSNSNVIECKANDGYFECEAAEHDVLVSLQAPSHLVPKESVNIDVHVQNVGRNNETNIVLHLIIDGTTVDTAQVDSMLAGSSYILSYTWTPQNEIRYNVTGYAPPLAGEDNIFNNVDSKTVAVSYVIRVPADFSTINEAIQAASSGDTIRVARGTYFEHVMIDRTVTLIGEDVNNTVIDGSGSLKVVTVGKQWAFGYYGSRSRISGFTVQNGLIGIYVESQGNIIEENIVRNLEVGLLLWNGYNVIKRNTITDNGCGIVCNGGENQIYHNNFINNTDQAIAAGQDEWNNEDEGNYWSDYNGTDTNKDEKGDIPYLVNVTQGTWDYYPLVAAYTFLVGDLNDDGETNVLDLGVAAAAFGTYPRHMRWNPTADANNDGKVDMIDMVIVAKNLEKTG